MRKRTPESTLLAPTRQEISRKRRDIIISIPFSSFFCYLFSCFLCVLLFLLFFTYISLHAADRKGLLVWRDDTSSLRHIFYLLGFSPTICLQRATSIVYFYFCIIKYFISFTKSKVDTLFILLYLIRLNLKGQLNASNRFIWLWLSVVNY